MTTKAKLSIVAILSCCALVGVGFANWTISQGPVSQNVQVSVSAEPVLSCSAPEVDSIRYSSQGFTTVKEDNTVTFAYSTTFNVKYTITSGGYTGKVALEATMKYSQNLATDTNKKDLFTENTFLSATVNDVLMSDSNTSDSQFSFATEVECTAGLTTTVTITYTLNFSTLENYTTYFYNVFAAGDAPQFTFNATLKGGNEA